MVNKWINESLLIKAIDSTGAGVAISDPNLADNPLIYVNKGFEVLTGYSKEEVLGVNCRFLQGSQTEQPALLEIRQALKEKRDCEVEVLNYKKNGEAFWNGLIITPTFDAEGKLAYFIGIQRDITARKKSEETLRLYEKVIENTMQGVMITDASTNIILVNEAFTDLTGYELEDVLGKNPRILGSGKHDDSFYRQLWKQIVEQGHWKGEIWNRKKNGEVFAEFLHISEVKNEQQQVTNYVAIFSDITERVHIEEKLKISNKTLARLSTQDSLTGIANRRKFDHYLESKWKSLAEVHESISLILLDIDFFKSYNDTYGHQKGDRCLTRVATIIKESVKRSTDLVARYGGEEFAIVLAQCDSKSAMDIAEDIRRNIELQQIQHESSDVANIVTVSVGVATLVPSSQYNLSQLIDHADEALYNAKRQGRNRVIFF